MPEHVPSAEGNPSPPPAEVAATPIPAARVEEYDRLNFPLICLAENLHDIETTRISMGNRMRQLAEQGGDQEVARLTLLHDGLAALEHQAVLDLQRAMRAHPLGPWVKRSRGVGEKQAARLLAAIGNPYWNSLHERPRRGPAELWAYCGYHVISSVDHRRLDAHTSAVDGRAPLPASHRPSVAHTSIAGGQPRATPTDHEGGDPLMPSVGGVAPKRRKGQKSNWNSAARMRAYLVAESCMKSSGDYRQVYDDGRAKYAELSKGHAHNRALRLVAKAVLRDIWIEARVWHEG